MTKKENIIFFVYALSVLIFLLLTTKYLSLNDIMHVAQQWDVISYTEISKYAPNLPYENEDIMKHIAQRFFIPYLVGVISFYTGLQIFFIFKLFTFLFILLFMTTIYLCLAKTNLNLKIRILFFSLLSLNPYIIRHHIFQPVQAHDMLLFSFVLIISYLIIFNKNKLIIFFSVFPIFLRQSSIALFVGSLLMLIKNKKYFLGLVLSVIFFITFRYISNISNIISNDSFNLRYAYGIIFFDFSKIEELIRFLMLPIMSFFPLLIFIFSKFNKEADLKTFLILLLICSMMIGQPILAGPDYSGRNVVRIASLCYPALVALLFYSFNISNIISKKILYYPFIVGLFFWSLHPTFSIFNYFSILRF